MNVLNSYRLDTGVDAVLKEQVMEVMNVCVCVFDG